MHMQSAWIENMLAQTTERLEIGRDSTDDFRHALCAGTRLGILRWICGALQSLELGRSLSRSRGRPKSAHLEGRLRPRLLARSRFPDQLSIGYKVSDTVISTNGLCCSTPQLHKWLCLTNIFCWGSSECTHQAVKSENVCRALPHKLLERTLFL